MTPSAFAAPMRRRMGDLAEYLRSERTDRLVVLALYLVVLFPAVDYVLRRIPVVRMGAPLWDQVLLLFLISVTLARRGEGKRRYLPALVPLLALSAALAVLDLNYPVAALEGLRVTLQFIPFFFAARHLVRTESLRFGLLQGLALTAIAVAGLGLIQPLIGVQTPAGWVDLTETIGIRIFSIVQSPNVLGGHMALASALILGMAWYEDRPAYRVLWLAGAGITGLTLLLTFSRGAWLAFAAAVLVLTFVLDRRIFVILLVVALVVGLGLPQIRGRFLHIFTEEYLEKSALDGRLGRWLRAYDQLRMRPLFGLGPGRYGGAVAARRFGIAYVDNYYVKTVAETGLVGLAAFLYWLGALGRAAYFRWRRIRWTRWWKLSAGALCGLLAVVLHNGVENIFEVPYLNAYFWFALGLMLWARGDEGREGECE